MTKKFNMCQLVIGHSTYVISAEIAQSLFSAMQGEDIYRLDRSWEDGQYVDYLKPVEMESMPQLRTIGPVQFHMALENQRAKDERDAAAKKDS